MHDANTPTLTPTGVPPPRRGDEPRDQEHLDFLSRIADTGTVTRELAAAAIRVWSGAKVQTENRVAVPVATAVDGGPIGFNWDDRDRHLEAEIVDTETVEWFLRNRATGDVLEHDCQPGDSLPPEWVSLLELFPTPTGSNG